MCIQIFYNPIAVSPKLSSSHKTCPATTNLGHFQNPFPTQSTMDVSHVPYRLAAAYILSRLKEAGISTPVIGIICGSGLSGLSSAMQDTLTISYEELPGFSNCTVPGHQGEVVLGTLSGVPCMCFRGRFHSYEGHGLKTVALPAYVMRCVGVRICIVTNAAGGLDPSLAVGTVLCVSDHVALPHLAGRNPLVGPNDEALGPRFPPTSNAYPLALRQAAQRAADNLGFRFVRGSGTYCFVSGPMYESKAECRWLSQLGGQAVGMSTVPEIVVAHYCGLATLCLSLITNQVIMDDNNNAAAASHEEVLAAVQQRSTQMQALVQEIAAVLRTDVLPTLAPLPTVSLEVPDQVQRQYAAQQQQQQSTIGPAAYWWAAAAAVFAAGYIVGVSKRPR
jgi:purine-nucleoside phosphorylase